MAPRPPVALAVGAALACLAAGCSESAPPVATVTPSEYVSAVERLMDPPSRMAATISERARRPDQTTPSRERLQDLVTSARRRLAEFRGLRLGDPSLRRQRQRLAAAYARMVPRMQTAADALAPAPGGGPAIADGLASVRARAALPDAVDPFLNSLRTLPSAASSLSSR
ncbi:MAG: hypothetical protein AB7V62_04810 [Thermoleophilia bacterium]